MAEKKEDFCHWIPEPDWKQKTDVQRIIIELVARKQAPTKVPSHMTNENYNQYQLKLIKAVIVVYHT